jgi:hypothetical protein
VNLGNALGRLGERESRAALVAFVASTQAVAINGALRCARKAASFPAEIRRWRRFGKPFTGGHCAAPWRDSPASPRRRLRRRSWRIYFGRLGMPQRRAVTLSAVAAAVVADPHLFAAGRSLQEAVTQLRTLPIAKARKRNQWLQCVRPVIRHESPARRDTARQGASFRRRQD